MAGNSRHPGTSVGSRILSLLAAFDEQHRAMTLSDLARRTDLPLATAHRLVGELVEWGALARTPSGTYVVGRRLWNVGLLAPVPFELRHIASPFLHDLYAATLATTHLAVRDGDQVLYIDRLSGHASVPIVSDIGSRLPLHCTGVGKILLAHAPEEVQRRVLSDLPRMTPYTITVPGRLRDQLRRAHRDGYAQTVEEMSLGACSLAVPIHVADGSVIAALGVVVSELRRDRARLVSAMTVAAQGIGRSVSNASRAV
ncbi:MAG: IclR family transcriptional regulator [Nocardioidaceae bacterium]|nr:IclR family transcriptional regulator [Nocardioidaceae bacterium]